MTLGIKIKSKLKLDRGTKFLVELDANKMERLMANLGFFNEDFLKSLKSAEKDCKTGKIKKIKSLKEL